LTRGCPAIAAPNAIGIDGWAWRHAKGERLRRSPAKIANADVLVQKGGYRHFMAKEIHEQPRVVGQTIAQYIDAGCAAVKMPKDLSSCFRDVNRISITACGTAFYAGLTRSR
jgi:glucosamine--fructose-6-phosphate aminotransferase (isomerizing)